LKENSAGGPAARAIFLRVVLQGPHRDDYPRRWGSAREIEIFATGHFASFSTQSVDSCRRLRADTVEEVAQLLGWRNLSL
jgi:hypothetical protein